MNLGLTTSLFEAGPAAGTAPARVAEWFRNEIAEGHDIDPELSADRLVDLVLRPVPHLSGSYLTAYQDPQQVRALTRPTSLGVVS